MRNTAVNVAVGGETRGIQEMGRLEEKAFRRQALLHKIPNDRHASDLEGEPCRTLRSYAARKRSDESSILFRSPIREKVRENSMNFTVFCRVVSCVHMMAVRWLEGRYVLEGNEEAMRISSSEGVTISSAGRKTEEST
jgi:hypothetical protein